MKKLFLITPLLFAQTLNANDLVCTLVPQCHFFSDFTKKEESIFGVKTFRAGQDSRLLLRSNNKTYTNAKNKNNGDAQALKVENCFKAAVEFAETLKDSTAKDLGNDSDEIACKAFVKWSFIDINKQKFIEGKVSGETKKILTSIYNSPKVTSLKIEGDNRFFSKILEKTGDTVFLPFDGTAFNPEVFN